MNSSGETGHPWIGEYTCGANALVMLGTGSGEITTSDYETLKQMVDVEADFSSFGLVHTETIKCSDYGGTFARTIVSCSFKAHSWTYMENFVVNTLGIPSHGYVDRDSNPDYLAKTKEAIDHNGFALQGVGSDWLWGHIFVVIGYTDDNLDGFADRIIVNDSFTDLMNATASNHPYTFNGKGAIYTVDGNGIVFNSFNAFWED